MIIRKSDLTAAALELGMWETLCEMAGVDARKNNPDDVDIEITNAKIVS